MAWAFVTGQFAQNSAAASGGAITATLPGNTTAGSTIVCCIACASQTDVPASVTHNAVGLTLRDSITNAEGWQMRWYTLDNIAGGATTVIYTPTANQSFRAIAVAEYSGLLPSGSYARGSWNRQSPSVTATDGTVSGTVNTTTDQVPYLQVGITVDFNDTNDPAIGTGYAARGNGWVFGGAVQAMQWEDANRTSASATEQATFTFPATSGISYTGQIILLEPITQVVLPIMGQAML